MVEGRSSGSRIYLLFAPSHLIKTKQWYLQISSPITAAGPLPVYTGFPVKPFWAPWVSCYRRRELMSIEKINVQGFNVQWFRVKDKPARAG